MTDLLVSCEVKVQESHVWDGRKMSATLCRWKASKLENDNAIFEHVELKVKDYS